jgi:hypothetical protein
MNPHRSTRNLLVTLGLTLGVVVGFGAASASAASYGELLRFGERKNQGSAPFGNLSGAKKEEEPLHYAIGVDPTENAVFVLDEPVAAKEVGDAKTETCHTERHVRIQKFSATGTAMASVSFIVDSPQIEEGHCAESEPEDFSNIAVDPEKGVLYVLAEEPREAAQTIDFEAPAASALYAFKTKESGKELLPAEHANSEGLLASAATLQAESATAGQALLEPHGIAVDPATHEVIILAHVDQTGTATDEFANDRVALQRVTSEGELGQRYVDEKDFFVTHARVPKTSPTSPVVAGSGEHEKVLVRFEGITEIPYEFATATTAGTEPTQPFAETGKTIGTLEIGTENLQGGSLSLSPEGTLYEPASIANEALSEGNAEGNVEKAGIAERSVASLSDAFGGLLGWTGGQSQVLTRTNDDCVLEPGGEEEPLLIAAGSKGAVFVLAPEYLKAAEPPDFDPVSKDAVVELGPEGKGCPVAKATPVKLGRHGAEIPESEAVANDKELQFSTMVDQADALSVTWTIENKADTAEKTEVTPNPLEFILSEANSLLQLPTLDSEFKSFFKSGGEYLVSAKIKTDDLATPADIETPTRTVKVDVPAEVETPPASKTVKEGEAASFTVKAAGLPTPSIHWELSTDEGKKFSEVAGPGATSETLTIKSTSMSESGYEYRARLENEIENETINVQSAAATLTVTSLSGGIPPKVTHQPENRTVTEPEKATFTAEATGTPTPTVQWEVSKGGAPYAPDTTDPGKTSDTLTVENTNAGESGSKYRAKFTNAEGSVTSSEVTLTINKKPEIIKPPEEFHPPAKTEVLPEKVVQPPPVPIATVAGSSLSVTPAGAVTLKITCPAGETRCIGTVTLRTLTAVSASSHHKGKRAILTLASGAFSVAGGGSQAVTLHLSSTARGLLAHSHTLRVKAIVAAHDLAGATHTQEPVVTLRLVAAKKKKH